MKVKKPNLVESMLQEEIDPQNDSTEEIAKKVQQEVQAGTDNTKTVTPQNAQATAEEIKETGAEINAGGAAVITEVDIESANSLVDTLDRALKTAKRNSRSHSKAGANVLVTGLPGSGKTAVVYSWAKRNGINVFYLDAKDPNLETVINGMPLRDITATDKNAVTKAYSNVLAPLHRPNSVLFLDELNRQVKPHIRASLLTLINEKMVSGNNSTGREDFGDTLLFTVACINPAIATDVGASPLNDAEKGRFLFQTTYDSTSSSANDFLSKYYTAKIKHLDKNDQYYDEDLENYLRSLDIASYLLGHKDFKFDDLRASEDAATQDKTMLSQRNLTAALEFAAGDVKELKKWVTDYSNLLPNTVKMLNNILKDYKAPTLDSLKVKAGLAEPETAAETTDDEDEDEVFKPKDSLDVTDAEKALGAFTQGWGI